MNSVEVHDLLKLIAATSSRNAKEDLLRSHIEDPLVQNVVRYAYDPFITFGLNPELPDAIGTGTFDGQSTVIWPFLDQLAKSQLTGNAAREELARVFGTLEAKSAGLLWAIMRKDLRCGISEKTINGVLRNTVPTFDLMLSKAYEEKRVKVFPVAVEPKLDGFRGMSLVSGGVSKAFSRVGNHFPQLDWAGPFLAEMVANAHKRAFDLSVAGSAAGEAFYRWLGGDEGPSLALDGEAVSGSYKTTSGDLRRKDEEATDTILNLFDAVPYAFMRDTGEIEWKVPLKVRRKFLRYVAASAPAGAPIALTDFREVNSHEEIQAIYAEHRAAGLEGAMVKPLEGHYVKKKGHIWMKIKAEETKDLRVVGWFEGEPGTRLDGKFAGYIVDHEGVDVAVGGGFKHAFLEETDATIRTVPAGEPYKNRGKVCRKFVTPGRLMEVEFHEVTPDGSLRHPRFIRWRDDKDENLRVAA